MTTKTIPISVRQKEIVSKYFKELDVHMEDLKDGRAEQTFEIKDFADKLHIHPTHLSNTISQVLGKSPCDIYEQRLVALAKELLLTSSLSISQIAGRMCYDPSNFTKFFKHFEGITPKQFRQAHV